MARQQQFAPVEYDQFRLEGGLDLITPTLEMAPGVARDALNFEVSVTGGYTRIAGYQAYDGRATASSAVYGTMTLSATAGLAVGTSFTDNNTGATGTVAWLSNNWVVYTQAVGTINSGDTIKVGGTTIGTVQANNTVPSDSKSLATYQAAAGAIYNALVQKVPGSGPVLGVVQYNGVVYAWRNNVGGTAAVIYKSSSTGWQAVPLGWTLAFTTGASTQPAEGSTVTGGTSGATGTIARVVATSGTGWTGQSGYFVLSATTGSFSAGEALKVGGVQIATAPASGFSATAITLLPNGKVNTAVGSITGGLPRVYGADGVNKGFEFDGTVYVPITTGMSPDAPADVALHKNYLWFSFLNSVQNSGIATPYIWSVVFGANEFQTNDVVTNLLPLPGNQAGGALMVTTPTNTYVLYGANPSTWQLISYNEGVGAAAYTAQNMDDAYALSDRGVIRLKTTLAYGNFDCATLTLPIRPFIQQRRTLATASALNREKSQYRVFYSDGYGLYVTIENSQPKGVMPVFFPDPVNVWCPGALANGSETSFIGSMGGYVYQLDTGPNFSGTAISAWITLNYNSENAPRVLKRYRRASL
ncbi:MAG: hypothetical protein JO142_10470, partial [Burkholderiales bacterium]|nr:hypothetical protein [Burkholderiales bacterium]